MAKKASKADRKALTTVVEGRIALRLRMGFDTPKTMTKRIVAELADEYRGAQVRAIVKARAPAMRRAWQAEKAAWPKQTDCDRLDAAFEELNAKGIMACHHWWCCGICGSGAMQEEFERMRGRWKRTPIIGFFFYDEQDTERAVEEGTIFLDYGTIEENTDSDEYEVKSIRIAKQAVRVLRSHGLKVRWNGRFDTSPMVTLDWKRRSRPARFWEYNEN